MSFEKTDQLREEFTDKYVVVDAARPELARFQNMTGQVKTINMNGRALVQFDGDSNRGWYDIAPEFLTVVDKPPPKPEKPAPKADKPAAKPAAKPAES